MAAATQDIITERRQVHLRVQAGAPAAASQKYYQGTFAGLNASSGAVRPLVAGDRFLGLVPEQVDNSSGSAGDKQLRLEGGIEIKRAVTGASAVGDRGKAVYATDDNVLTLSSAGNSLVGVVSEWLTGTTCWVHIYTQAELVAAQA